MTDVTPDYVFHLDLCTLSYQLHAQSLYWPLDPYGEEMAVPGKKADEYRKAFLSGVDAVFRAITDNSLKGPAYLRGNGQGWETNTKLDPTIGDYSRINPHVMGFSRQNSEFEPILVYDTPAAITKDIGEVQLATYDPTKAPGVGPRLARLPITVPAGGTSKDVLYAFEGATGVNKAGHGLWSLMGFVLLSHTATGYNVHVVFRGSRSGALREQRAWKAKGAADWVTDLGWGHDFPKPLTQLAHIPEVSPRRMHRGFGRCIRTMLPLVVLCLEDIATRKGAEVPENITFAGHSLGGALATSCASAIMFGQGPHQLDDPAFPQNVAAWPWRTVQAQQGQPAVQQKLQLVTFAAPPVGTPNFAGDLNLAITNQMRIWNSGDVIVWAIHHAGWLPFLAHSGTELKLYPHKKKEVAHDPATIRNHLATRMKYAPFRRSSDTYHPWLAIDQGVELLRKLATRHGDRKVQINPVGFTDGLRHYLEAMKEAPKGRYKFPKGEIDLTAAIDGLLTRLAASPLDLSDCKDIYGDMLTIEAIARTTPTADNSAKRMMRAWLALVVAEGDAKGWAKLSDKTVVDFVESPLG